MNDHSTRSAAESDLDSELANDPFLIGLDVTAPAPSSVAPSIDEEQRLAAAYAMLQQIEMQSGDAPDWPIDPAPRPRDGKPRSAEPFADPLLGLAPEPGPRPAPQSAGAREPWPHESAPPVAVVAADIPDGAILSANGQPFRDLDAARFKSRRLTDEAGEPFEVLPVTGGFVLVPSHDLSPVRSSLALPTPLAPQRPARASKPLANSAAAAETQEIDSLTLEDFPEGHAARKYGLPLFKAIHAQTRKPLRQAWRSQLPLLIAAAVGALVFLFPEAVVRLTVQPGAVAKFANPTFTKGIGVAGLALALFVLGKILYIRITQQSRI